MLAMERGSGRGHWLQVKGDPSVRDFLFYQTRVESEFDRHIDRVLAVTKTLLAQRGVFHVIVHFSSNQLICWPYLDPYRYHVYVGQEVLSEGFLDAFHPFIIRKPAIGPAELDRILAEFKRLRFKDENVYLRSGSINVITGMISMSFSCDGSHYLSFDTFSRVISNY